MKTQEERMQAKSHLTEQRLDTVILRHARAARHSRKGGKILMSTAVRAHTFPVVGVAVY
jgi:hypothetical protein